MLLLVENLDPEIDFSSDEKLIAIENILTTFGQALHIPLINNRVLEQIIKSESFGRIAKQYASNLLEQRREFSCLKAIVQRMIIIDFKERDLLHLLKKEDQTIVTVGYGFVLDLFRLDAPELLGEDELDSEFYKFIGVSYIRSKRNIANLGLNLKTAHGGGSRTYNRFMRKRQAKEFCICFVDNDKKHPNGPSGSTCRRFRKIDLKPDYFTEANILPVHEIESLLPLSYYESVINDKPEYHHYMEAIKFIDSIQKLDNRIRYHYDHKKGFNGIDIKELDKNHGEFWLPHLTKYIQDVNGCETICFSKKCTDEGSCKGTMGLGEKALQITCESLKMNMSLKAEDVCKSVQELWVDIGHKIFSWGCAPPRRVVS